ncbi:heme-binding protein [Paenibacillus sp. FSL H8-0034]|uniref:GlcG/HbpS family heme-binding protein n=2 Tax=Paenibacillus sp. FSL H8-0034 TaxID=2954671 RepID=UPI0030FCBD77
MTVMKLTLEIAKVLLEAAERKAKEMGLADDIAIVDDGANLIAFHRMDTARIAGIDIAQNKAWTSVAMKMPTSNLAQAALPGSPSFGINTTNHGKIVILGGGIPLMKDGLIIGGIGVSGGTSAQDIEVANAAIHVFEALKSKRDSAAISYRIGSNQPM